MCDAVFSRTPPKFSLIGNPRASAETGRTVRELCLEREVLPVEELERLLDPMRQTG